MKEELANLGEYSAIKRGGLTTALSLHFLRNLNVLCLPALGTFHNIELNSLTFLQCSEAGTLNCGVMDKHIFTVLTAKKAESFCIVKPFYNSLFH